MTQLMTVFRVRNSDILCMYHDVPETLVPDLTAYLDDLRNQEYVGSAQAVSGFEGCKPLAEELTQTLNYWQQNARIWERRSDLEMKRLGFSRDIGEERSRKVAYAMERQRKTEQLLERLHKELKQ